MRKQAASRQVGVMDCLGCGNCVDVCPGNPKLGKALTMVPLEGQETEAVNWNYCVENVKSKQNLVDIQSNVKNSQFATPLFEFSGACSGCGEQTDGYKREGRHKHTCCTRYSCLHSIQARMPTHRVSRT